MGRTKTNLLGEIDPNFSNTVTIVSETKQTIELSPEMAEIVKQSLVHYCNSHPDMIMEIVQSTITKVPQEISKFVMETLQQNEHIKSIFYEKRANEISILVVHDYSDSGEALDKIEPLLSLIEDKFEKIDFDFNVIHESNQVTGTQNYQQIL